MTKEPLDLAALRARLAGRRGKEYWRSLEELAETAGFQDLLRHEFPQGAALAISKVNKPFEPITHLLNTES